MFSYGVDSTSLTVGTRRTERRVHNHPPRHPEKPWMCDGGRGVATLQPHSYIPATEFFKHCIQNLSLKTKINVLTYGRLHKRKILHSKRRKCYYWVIEQKPSMVVAVWVKVKLMFLTFFSTIPIIKWWRKIFQRLKNRPLRYRFLKVQAWDFKEECTNWSFVKQII